MAMRKNVMSSSARKQISMGKRLHSDGNHATRGDTLLDIYLLNLESAFISCKEVPGISDNNGVLLEADWAENRCRAQARYTIKQIKYKQWAGNGNCVEEIWNSFKDIVFEGIQRYVPNKTLSMNPDQRYVPNKTLSMNPDPEYYDRDVKRLKAKVRRRYNQSRYSQNHQRELKILYKELLLTKKEGSRDFLSSALQNEGRSWAEFCKYVKRRRGTKENIPPIKDHNGNLITEPVDKANTLKSYYASIFSCKRNITVIRTTDATQLENDYHQSGGKRRSG